ncbi:unnamed protein product [Soboliphyme baturini]|uniref:Ig-like domain-containing protein n=1 Tax=Soboliphyme baturini TaxID=241478 RepID=A0A183J1U8_9BILA|nr:unnamed protein product [Soboliphyme baturini]
MDDFREQLKSTGNSSVRPDMELYAQISFRDMFNQPIPFVTPTAFVALVCYTNDTFGVPFTTDYRRVNWDWLYEFPSGKEFWVEAYERVSNLAPKYYCKNKDRSLSVTMDTDLQYGFCNTLTSFSDGLNKCKVGQYCLVDKSDDDRLKCVDEIPTFLCEASFMMWKYACYPFGRCLPICERKMTKYVAYLSSSSSPQEYLSLVQVTMVNGEEQQIHYYAGQYVKVAPNNGHSWTSIKFRLAVAKSGQGLNITCYVLCRPKESHHDDRKVAKNLIIHSLLIDEVEFKGAGRLVFDLGMPCYHEEIFRVGCFMKEPSMLTYINGVSFGNYFLSGVIHFR